MQYHAKLPESNHNVSHQNPIREFLSLLLGVVAIVLFVYWLLGFFVDVAVDYISPEMEMAMYQSMLGEELSTAAVPKKLSDTAVEMQTLLGDLSHCIDVDFPIELTFTDSDTPNAYAAPGGQMVVLSGLLNYVESENGLAFVLAHELGHFKNRDHLRGMGRSIVLFALSFLATGNSELSQLLAPVNEFQSAQFSQSSESAADATALDIVDCHYGHVTGATEFFETMAELSGAQLLFSHYFTSHPESQARVKAIHTLSQEKGYITGQTRHAFWTEQE